MTRAATKSRTSRARSKSRRSRAAEFFRAGRAKERMQADEMNPINRIRSRCAGKIAKRCHLVCFTCRKFVGHVKVHGGGCPGRAFRDLDDEKNPRPMCHVDLMTGRMEDPMTIDAAGWPTLIAGQERFWAIERLGGGLLATRLITN